MAEPSRPVAKSTRATIAKAVLGFANRSPDVAGRVADGCGYMVVSVEPGTVSGVEALDSAKLEAGVVVYTGHGPQWRADYVEVSKHTLLIVTVEPPRWVDPIHVLRKAFLPDDKNGKSMRSAAIYARHAASTEASPADMDVLDARMVRQPGTYLDVSVEPASDRDLVAVDDEEALEHFAESRRSLMLGTMRNQMPLGGFPAQAFGEYRTKEAFAQEVADWRRAAGPTPRGAQRPRR